MPRSVSQRVDIKCPPAQLSLVRPRACGAGCMAQTVGSDISRMAKKAGAKLLPGIFSDDGDGNAAPCDSAGAKASKAIADGNPAAAAEAALEASRKDDPAVRPGPQAATGGKDPEDVPRSMPDTRAAHGEVQPAPQRADKMGYEAHAQGVAAQHGEGRTRTAGEQGHTTLGEVGENIRDSMRDAVQMVTGGGGAGAAAAGEPAAQAMPAARLEASAGREGAPA